MRSRLALVALGVLTGSWGAYELLDRGWSNLVGAAVWLVGGVVLHDFVLAPVVVLLFFVGMKLVPASLHSAVTGALVVWGTVTILVVPVLGRFGARPDNPTLLDRNYAMGYLVFTVVVALYGVAAAALHQAGRRVPGAGGESATGAAAER